MIVVSGKTVGRKRPLFADWSFPPPPEIGDGGPITLRALIERIVRHEVRAFRERQVERTVERVLSRAQIDLGEERGKIDPGGRIAPQEVDAEEAVANAWQCFEDGLYLVVVDEVEQRDLDAPVYLKPDSAVTFVRLVMLAGG